MREGEALFTPIKTALYSLMLFKNACINQKKKYFGMRLFLGGPYVKLCRKLLFEKLQIGGYVTFFWQCHLKEAY